MERNNREVYIYSQVVEMRTEQDKFYNSYLLVRMLYCLLVWGREGKGLLGRLQFYILTRHCCRGLCVRNTKVEISPHHSQLVTKYLYPRLQVQGNWGHS